MISEGSCDTEDWSNDAENSDLITGINYILNCNNISQYYICIFDLLKAALLRIRYFFQNIKYFNESKLLTCSAQLCI